MKLTTIMQFVGWGTIDVDSRLKDCFMQNGSTLHPLYPTYMVGGYSQAGTHEEEYTIQRPGLAPIDFTVSWQDEGDTVYLRAAQE